MPIFLGRVNISLYKPPMFQAYSTLNMDAGGGVTAAWYIETFVKPAKSPNPFGNAAMSKSAASPRKCPPA